MALIDDVKTALRITSNAFDVEVSDLILSAKKDLEITGVDYLFIDESDPLIKRAITIYVKAHFGYDNSDFERLIKSYDLLKSHLSMSIDYEVVE